MIDTSGDIPHPRRTASRRAVLGLTAVSSAGLVLGSSYYAYGDNDGDPADPGGSPGGSPVAGEPAPENHHDVTAVRPEDLAPPPFGKGACGSTVSAQREIGSQPSYYEVTGKVTSFSYDPTFYRRLETWLTFFFANTPKSWARPAQIWSYGSYVNRGDGCTSYHNFGRAIDLARIYATDPTTGALRQVFNARFDRWRSLTGVSMTRTRRWYWATSASLHYHFKHVLTYRFNAQHHNHIHADDALARGGNSTFSTGSSVQVQHVQACCAYIWGHSMALDGIWGPITAKAVSKVLVRIGRTGSLLSQANWLAFNRATLRFGSGAQTF